MGSAGTTAAGRRTWRAARAARSDGGWRCIAPSAVAADGTITAATVSSFAFADPGTDSGCASYYDARVGS